MTRLIVTFKLLAPENRAAFESFMRDFDAPAARALETVTSWELMVVDPPGPSADYVAVADVTDLEAWLTEAQPGMDRMGPQLARLAETTSLICHPLL